MAHQHRTRPASKFAPAAIAIALTAVLLAGPAASATSQGQGTREDGTVVYGALPSPGTPAAGGTISVGQLSGSTPTYIFPIVPGADTDTANLDLISNLFLPLYGVTDGAQPQLDPTLDLADPPVASDGDRVFTITLKHGFRWTDGHSVDAADVIFGFDLLKAAVSESPANWGQDIPGQFPQNVKSATAIGSTTVRFTLKSPMNPSYFLYNQLQDTGFGLSALPSTAWNIAAAHGPHLNYSVPANAKKIYNYLAKQGQRTSSFAASSLWKDVDGPYRLSGFDPTDSDYRLSPNPHYGGAQKPRASVSAVTYASTADELAAVKAGKLDIASTYVTDLPALRSDIPHADAIFGAPGFGWTGAIINFKDRTDDFNHVIAQSYVRQAIEDLIDQSQIISSVDHGAAVPDYAPVPSAPASPFDASVATHPANPFDPSAAVKLLKAHGWHVVPGGATSCASPGTGARHCGAGIPKGTPIKFTWFDEPAAQSTIGVDESEILASAAKHSAGIDLELRTASFSALTSEYNDQDPAGARHENAWGVSNFATIETDFYPTQSGIQSAGAGFNFGDYDDPQAYRLMSQSLTSSNPKAVTAEETYLAQHPPVFYLPDSDTIEVVSPRVGGSATGFLALTGDYFEPQYLYIRK